MLHARSFGSYFFASLFLSPMTFVGYSEPDTEPEANSLNSEVQSRLVALIHKYANKCWRIRKQQLYFAQLGAQLRYNTSGELTELVKRAYDKRT